MLRRTLTVAGYSLVGLLMILITIALVAYGKGYSYDFKNHRFVLNGLVILKTIPDRGRVLINGQAARQETPYRATLEAGSYNFEIQKDGYRSWRKAIEVRASEVVFAEYVILFPNEIKTERQNLGQSAFGLDASPNRKTLSYMTSGKQAGVYLYDVKDRLSERIYSARRAGRKDAEVLESLVWSPDNDKLLLRTRYRKTTNYIVLNAGKDADPLNLTELFNQDFRQLTFNPNNSGEMYWTSPQSNLHRLNLEDRTASAVLASKVSAFGFGGGRVFYVQTTRLGKSLFSLERSTIRQELIQSLAESPSYEILYTRYEDKDYLMVVPAKARTATLYQDIFSRRPEAKVIARDVTHLKRSPSGRFLLAYNSNSVTTYDLKKEIYFDINLGYKKIESLDWFDEFHLLSKGDGKLSVTEYDGANHTVLENGILGTPFTNPDKEVIFGIAADGKNTEMLLHDLR